MQSKSQKAEISDASGAPVVSGQIAYRFFRKNSPAMYVANLKGDGGKDWGYTPDVEKAAILNTPNWRSFAKDMRECGTVAFAFALAPAREVQS